jgi:putative flippase GtrA
LTQSQRFCLVGTLGFVVDAGILQALVVGAQANLYAARVISYLLRRLLPGG